MRGLACWFVGVLAVLCGLVAAQRTLRVPSQYSTIQAAIDAAREGDTVLVAPGVYAGPIDFRGKNIVVRSSGGYAVTTLRGDGIGATVRFVSGERREAVLEGFTVTNGGRGGIECIKASPTIRQCRVAYNRARTWQSGPFCTYLAAGGGIYCSKSHAHIVECVIEANVAQANSPYQMCGASAGGGGIYVLDGNVRIERCLIIRNHVGAGHPGAIPNTSARGGGVRAIGATVIVNSAIVSNTVQGGDEGGGIAGTWLWGAQPLVLHCLVGGNGSSYRWTPGNGGVSGCTVVNSIVRQNSAPQLRWCRVSYSNIEGGAVGPGNIDVDPEFVDFKGGDFHLRPTSPCRDAGSEDVAPLPATDFEGNPRNADAAPDMGPDEFFAQLTAPATAPRGGLLKLRFLGPPERPLWLGMALGRAARGQLLPGLEGWLLLDPRSLVVVPVGPMPPQGLLSWSVPLPKALPPGTAHLQPLVGTQLGNAVAVQVR